MTNKYNPVFLNIAIINFVNQLLYISQNFGIEISLFTHNYACMSHVSINSHVIAYGFYTFFKKCIN